ncbi:MAG: hypothetical protein QXW20_07560 [Ignisphaera sp.]
MSRDAVSPGRIFVFMVIAVAFFITIVFAIRIIIDGLALIPEVVNTSIPVYIHDRPFNTLHSLARAIVKWIVDIFRSEFGIAIILLTVVIYMILTEKQST